MDKSILGLALVLIFVANGLRPATAAMDTEGCKGNACAELSSVWIDNGFKFSNDGTKPLRLTLEPGEKGNCGAPESFGLAPGEKVRYDKPNFCSPVKAHYGAGRQ